MPLMKKTIFVILITFLFSLITGCDSQIPYGYTDGFYRGYSFKPTYPSQTYDFTDNFIGGVLCNMELESICDEMDWQNMMQNMELDRIHFEMESMRAEMELNQILNDDGF